MGHRQLDALLQPSELSNSLPGPLSSPSRLDGHVIELGIAVVPHSIVDRIMLPDVSFREIAGEIVPSEIALAYRRHEKSPATRAFIDQARKSAGKNDMQTTSPG